MKVDISSNKKKLSRGFIYCFSPALHNAQVAAVIVDEHHGKVEILSHRRGEKHVDINNAVHRYRP